MKCWNSSSNQTKRHRRHSEPARLLAQVHPTERGRALMVEVGIISSSLLQACGGGTSGTHYWTMPMSGTKGTMKALEAIQTLSGLATRRMVAVNNIPARCTSLGTIDATPHSRVHATFASASYPIQILRGRTRLSMPEALAALAHRDPPIMAKTR